MNVPSISFNTPKYSQYIIKEKTSSNFEREESIGVQPQPKSDACIGAGAYGITFGYRHPIKTMWLKGRLPWLQYGFYGEKLTKRNISIEHLKPVAAFTEECGGDKAKAQKLSTTWDNVVLASNRNNNLRGCDPLSSVIDYEAMGKYLQQFKGKYIPGFGPGEKYIKGYGPLSAKSCL